MFKRFVNLTPHPVTFRLEDGTDVVFPPRMKDGKPDPCRVEVTTKQVEPIEWMPCVENRWNDIEGLPDPEYTDNHPIYIVSLIVLQFIERAGYGYIGRTHYGDVLYDIVSPDTGPNSGCIRDEKGQVIAVTRWVRPSA